MHWSILINGWSSHTSIVRAVYVATIMKKKKNEEKNKRTKQNTVIEYNVEWMSLLLKKKKKKCAAMFTTMLLFVIAEDKMRWRGERGAGDYWYLYRFTVIMHLSSHSTDGRKGGREESKQLTRYRKDSSVGIWTPFAVLPSSKGKRWTRVCMCVRIHVWM